MLYSSHKWISISHNLNTKGYIRIVQNSVFIRKNPGEQMILVPRKLLLLHICDCNRLRAKIDGLSAHQVPWRLWKSRAWITYFTFWTSTGTNIKQKQEKKGKNKKEKKINPLFVPGSLLAALDLIFPVSVAMLQSTWDWGNTNLFLRCSATIWELQVFVSVQISLVILKNPFNLPVSIPHTTKGGCYFTFFGWCFENVL